MRNLCSLDQYRFEDGDMQRYGRYGGEKLGVFIVPGENGGPNLQIIADCGQGWEHVSISVAVVDGKDRTPTWEEMDRIKRLFFKDHEVVMQLHVGVEDHVNIHPYCLHLWRPRTRYIPVPPKDRV